MDRCYLHPAVASQEQRRRLAIWARLCVLCVLAFGPLVSHFAPAYARDALAQYDRIGVVCLYALHALLAPVHGFFHVLLIAGLACATWDRLRAWRRQRAVLRALPCVQPSADDAFGRAARDAGIDPARILVIEGLPTPALTVGLLAPRILVAYALARQLDPAQLTAVLAHEGAHLRRRDPLRVFLLRFLTRVLFWLPTLERLGDEFLEDAEIQADDYAARAGRDGGSVERSLALASALITLAGAYCPHPIAEPGIGIRPLTSTGLLGRRVRRLAGEVPPIEIRATSFGALRALLTLGLVWLSILPVLHPVPADTPMTSIGRCAHAGPRPFGRACPCPHAPPRAIHRAGPRTAVTRQPAPRS
jgi:Zn-dependent protease with chaperone function